MSPLVAIVLMFTVMGLAITAVLLVTAETVRLIGWLMAGIVEVGVGSPASALTVFEGTAYSFLGLLWVTVSGSGVGWVGTWLLNGDDEGAFLGAVSIPVMLALWCLLTLRLNRIRAAVSRARGIPEDPWTWMRQHWSRTR